MKEIDRGRLARGRRGGNRFQRRSRVGGFSLTEVTISFSVVLTVLLAFTRLLLGTTVASSTQQDSTLAKEAARQTIEVLQATPFDQVFALYNGDLADDPGPGPAPGSNFAVAGLAAREGDVDGLPGEIVFPTLAGAPGVLREDLQLAQLGMPRDLSGDGQIDTQDHSDDHIVLPVLVRIEWRTTRGSARLEFRTLLASF